jgi:hypothetical protein
MVGERINMDEARAGVSDDRSDEPAKRDRSTIDFPYLGLEAAEEVAMALYDRHGLSPCEIDELAAQMGQSLSGAFRQKTAAAKTFGVVDKDGRSAFVLTEIGRKIVEPTTLREGRVEAFLAVPLYRSIYDKYRGQYLPPAKALEREMESLGVARKQTDRARQAFERSAAHAGFFDAGKNRLVKPAIGESAEAPRSEKDRGGVSGGGGNEPPAIDPIIQGLLARLPKSGSVWPEDDRELWLELLKGSFKLIYKNRLPENKTPGPEGAEDVFR